MGKSAKKSASKDAAVAVPAPAPAKPLKKRKREAEVVVIEKELASAKKQNVVAGNKSEKKVVKKKVESDTESAQKPEKKPAPFAKKEGDIEDVAPAPKKKKQSIGGAGSKTLFVGNLSFDAKESDIKEFFKPAGEVVKIRLATDPKDDKFRGFCHVELATAKQAEKALRELNGKVMLQRAVKIDLANRKAAQREQAKDDSTGDGGSKTLFVGNLSFDTKEADIKEFFEPAGEVVGIRLAKDPKDDKFRGFCHVDFATAEQAENALRELNGEVLLQRLVRIHLTDRKAPRREQVKDDSTDGGGSRILFVGNLSFDANEKHIEEFFEPVGEVVAIRLATDPTDDKFRGFCYVELATAKQAEKAVQKLNGKVMFQRAVRVDLAKRKSPADREAAQMERKKDDSQRGPGPEAVCDGGPNRLYVGNLSFSAKEADIKKFFKPAGGVVKIRLATDARDGMFRGFCHVDFATDEQAEKALLELNGKVMLQRVVRLERASDSAMESRPEAVFVKGFDSSEGEDKIRSSLMAHFSPCGEIYRISIPTGVDGNSKGFAYVQFRDEDSRIKSLGLNGSEFGNGSLKVDETGDKSASGRSGLGGGRGRGGRRGGP